jgi:hypothetical protein
MDRATRQLTLQNNDDNVVEVSIATLTSARAVDDNDRASGTNSFRGRPEQQCHDESSSGILHEMFNLNLAAVFIYLTGACHSPDSVRFLFGTAGICRWHLQS